MFEYDYLPEPTDPRAWLALALFREGLNLKNVHYQFLSYYKIINILHERGMPDPKRGGPAQVTWINQTLPHLKDSDAKKRFQELQGQVANVGEYIYVSGRCAIAHAFAKPVADPDDPENTMRLSNDLRLVAALAEYAIESEFGVKSAATVRREHLYELAGFRQILGAHLSTEIKSKAAVDLASLPMFPRIRLSANRDGETASLPPISVRPEVLKDGYLVLAGSTEDRLMHIQVVLDFSQERLGFSPEDDVVCYEDGSAHAIQYAILSLNLFETLFRNGRLEAWNADTGTCLGKTDAYIPHNVDSRRTLNRNAIIRDRLETMWWVRSSPFVDACAI
jgi:hypothetical protein